MNDEKLRNYYETIVSNICGEFFKLRREPAECLAEVQLIVSYDTLNYGELDFDNGRHVFWNGNRFWLEISTVSQVGY